jgi:hypothetical protein
MTYFPERASAELRPVGGGVMGDDGSARGAAATRAAAPEAQHCDPPLQVVRSWTIATAVRPADVPPGDVLVATWDVEQGRSLVGTCDVGPHWCPDEFLAWDGLAPVVGGMRRWRGADGVPR